MYFDSSMKITKHINIYIKDIIKGYRRECELAPNESLMANDGKLCIRPEFQRSFVYSKVQADAVIDSILHEYPLNNMYWIEDTINEGHYNCGDGQQRTISICDFAIGTESVTIKGFNNDLPFYIHDLQYKYPELYDKFMNYQLEIFICSHGTKDEVSKWFEAINTHGEVLTPQELRNANFTGKWLRDAKQYFSKSNARGAACPAERDGRDYIPSSIKAERQEYLELAIKWKINSSKNEDIWNYMQAHYLDDDASELIEYYKTVLTWVKEMFPTMQSAQSKQKFWGEIYNKYANDKNTYDPTDLMDTFNLLFSNKDELNGITIRKIIDYCFTKDPNLLNPRQFSQNQRVSMYERQKHKCACCGKVFPLTELDADHITPWDLGGKTDTSNGQLLCKPCHINKHNPTVKFNNY